MKEQIEKIGEREKRVVLELSNDLDRILHKYVNMSPRQYASKEFSERYRDMGIDIDLVGITTDLLNAGYRKQREGEWIIKGLANPKCSACNSYNRCGDKSDFCPNCGAKMKGTNDEKTD